jgi:hypothetical protein
MNATVTPILSRRDLGKVRRASYWQNRADAAPDAKGRAAVAWDSFRARVKRRPQAEQDALWRQVEVMFNGLAPDLGLPKIKEEAI